MIGCQPKPEAPTTAVTPKSEVAKPVAAKTGGSSVRRSVKTSTDPDAAKIDKSAKDTTIEDIVAQKVPGDLQGRSEPFETSTWRVKARLKSVQLMKDGDYYLVMKGEKGGQTVVEVPDPEQCKGSPLQGEIAEARKQIEEKYHPTKEVKKLDEPATVTGVGFLGWRGSAAKSTTKSTAKAGESRTGPRLMPGTGFKFGE